MVTSYTVCEQNSTKFLLVPSASASIALKFIMKPSKYYVAFCFWRTTICVSTNTHTTGKLQLSHFAHSLTLCFAPPERTFLWPPHPLWKTSCRRPATFYKRKVAVNTKIDPIKLLRMGRPHKWGYRFLQFAVRYCEPCVRQHEHSYVKDAMHTPVPWN